MPTVSPKKGNKDAFDSSLKCCQIEYRDYFSHDLTNNLGNYLVFYIKPFKP